MFSVVKVLKTSTTENTEFHGGKTQRGFSNGGPIQAGLWLEWAVLSADQMHVRHRLTLFPIPILRPVPASADLRTGRSPDELFFPSAAATLNPICVV